MALFSASSVAGMFAFAAARFSRMRMAAFDMHSGRALDVDADDATDIDDDEPAGFMSTSLSASCLMGAGTRNGCDVDGPSSVPRGVGGGALGPRSPSSLGSAIASSHTHDESVVMKMMSR